MDATTDTRESRDMRGAVADWTRLLVATLARVVLFTLIGGLFWSAVPALWGWRSTTVMSDSMAPGIRTGDVVVTMPVAPDDLALGKVVLVNDPDHEGRLRLHRFVATTDDGDLVTRGDANPQNDSSPVEVADVVGVGVLRTPLVGLPFVWAAQGDTVELAALAAGLLGLLALTRVDAPLRRPAVEGGRPRERQRRRASGALAAGATAPVATVAIAAVVGVGAHAAFASPTTGPASTFGAAASYPCFAVTPSDSPYLYYAFDEADGAAALDSSGAGRSGSLQSGATRASGSCAAGDSPAIALDGSSAGQVVTPGGAISAPNDFSVEAWFQTTSTTGGKIIGFGNSASGASSRFDRHVYLTDDGKVVFGVHSLLSPHTAISPRSYNDGAWHHVVATMDRGVLGFGSGMKLYVDGVLVATNSNTALQVSTGYWRIGYDSVSGWPSAPTSAGFSGRLDGVGVYSTALTAAQVTAHHGRGRL